MVTAETWRHGDVKIYLVVFLALAGCSFSSQLPEPAPTIALGTPVATTATAGVEASLPAPTPLEAPTIEAGPEQTLLDLINTRRAAAGCSAPLVMASELAAAARAHSEDMAGGDFLDHMGSDGSDPGERIAAAGYVPGAGEPGAPIWAENLAAGYSDPAAVVDGWMSSEGHRVNMLNCGFREAGVGLVQREGTSYTFYWTAVFAAGR